MNSKIQYYKLCSSIVQYQLFFLQIIFLQQSYFKIVRRHFTIVVQLETKNSLVYTTQCIHIKEKKLSTDKWIQGQTGMQTFTYEIHKKEKEIFLNFENRNVGTQINVSIYQELTCSSTFSRGHIQSKFGTTLATPSSPLKKYNNLCNKIIYN